MHNFTITFKPNAVKFYFLQNRLMHKIFSCLEPTNHLFSYLFNSNKYLSFMPDRLQVFKLPLMNNIQSTDLCRLKINIKEFWEFCVRYETASDQKDFERGPFLQSSGKDTYSNSYTLCKSRINISNKYSLSTILW